MSTEKEVALDELIGLHKLTAVDMSEYPVREYEHANAINFTLDGKTYTAVEDPSDGYRSSMERLFVSNKKLINVFKAQRVLGVMRGRENYYDNDVIDFYDVVTSKIVLSVGTRNTSDYYPSFVAEFSPENMAINATPAPTAPTPESEKR